jgi:hypothetical protein
LNDVIEKYPVFVRDVEDMSEIPFGLYIDEKVPMDSWEALPCPVYLFAGNPQSDTWIVEIEAVLEPGWDKDHPSGHTRLGLSVTSRLCGDALSEEGK